MKEQFITEQNRYAMNILETFGYQVHFNSPSRATSTTTTITICKDGQKDMFLSCNTMLDVAYAVKFIEEKSFAKGHAKGKEDIINTFKNLLRIN